MGCDWGPGLGWGLDLDWGFVLGGLDWVALALGWLRNITMELAGMPTG